MILFGDNLMRFVPCRNSIEGRARGGLYEPCDEDMAKVFALIDAGWDWVASVHSHPTFSPYPSSIDLNQLFPNQRINLIWSLIYPGSLKFYDCRGVDLFPGRGQKAIPVLAV
jgi:proteasome lid subunit RPN8/RPN11